MIRVSGGKRSGSGSGLGREGKDKGRMRFESLDNNCAFVVFSMESLLAKCTTFFGNINQEFMGMASRH